MQNICHYFRTQLRSTFIDCGILSAITEWLAPLPDKSLPCLKTRESLLKELQSVRSKSDHSFLCISTKCTTHYLIFLVSFQFPDISSETLKMSGIGKALMYLFKHPKELKHNKDLAGRLIRE